MDMESSKVYDASVALSVDGPVQVNGIREDGELGDVILEDFETYWQDISDRLTVSRMVNDSVVKGMVNAVEEEAAKKIAAKEAELAELKETLHLYHVGAEDTRSSGYRITCCEAKDARDGISSGVSASEQHNGIEVSLASLGILAREQLQKLKRDIDSARGSDSVSRSGSGSQLVGLGGILPEQLSGRWTDVDKSLNSLAVILDSVCRQVDSVSSTKTSLGEYHQEQEFLGYIEDMVTRSCIRSLQEEFEEKLWQQNARLCGKETADWVEKINAISSLREELEAISRSITHIETAHLASQGSLDTGEELRPDYFYRKSLGHVWEGNGKHEVTESNLPDIDSTRLKHMSSEDLIQFYNKEMTLIKRNHESQLQEITEELYTLKRERLKERGSSVPVKRDKDMDMLKKKIQQIMPKLEYVLKESDKFPSANNVESIESMKERVESLISENHHLGDLLTDKKKEIKSLSLQVTDALERLSQSSAAAATFAKLIENLRNYFEDAQVKAAISEEVYKCILREVTGQVRCILEESVVTDNIMHDIYETLFEEAAQRVEPHSNFVLEDSDMESIMMQELCGVVFEEAFNELNTLNSVYVGENERLKRELAASREEKEQLSLELESELAKQRDELDSITQELNKWRDQTSHQQMLISKANEESNTSRSNLFEAQREIEQYKKDLYALNQKLESTKEEMKKIDEERTGLEKYVLQNESREREHRKQVESIILFVQEHLKSVDDMEHRVTEDCKKLALRLENLSPQVNPLVHKASTLRKAVSIYKKRLETKCSDLQKAEAEVDLLGDEVDTLLSLLEKIYIALDHYSPILQHYPGITEILKLVKRELSGESAKTA